MGRPPKPRTVVILEHQTWTRDRLKALMQKRAQDAPDLTKSEADVLGQLEHDQLPSFIPHWDPEDEDIRTVVALYEAGRDMESIAADLVLPLDLVQEALRDFVIAEVVHACLRGAGRPEFIALADRFGVHIDTVYTIRHRFTCYASANLERGELTVMCTHLDKGGDGQAPLAERRVWAGSQCRACDIKTAFDRFGNPVFTDLQLFASQASQLKAYGVSLVAREPAAA